MTTGSRDGDGGGAALWWDMINHLKAKDFRSSNQPALEGREPTSGACFSAAGGFPAAERHAGVSDAQTGATARGPPLLPDGWPGLHRAGQGGSAPTEDLR